MKDEFIPQIIQAVKTSVPKAASAEITADTRFGEIPDMDSMSIVNFQMELSALIGEKASEVAPVPEMTVGEYAELLAGL